MFGFPDSAECPIDMSGNPASGGGPLRPHYVDRDHGFHEGFFAHAHGRIFDRALTPDEVKREYDTQRITVNKRTHRIKFENETESSVDVVIEPKGRGDLHQE
jgi:hypothetical protein